MDIKADIMFIKDTLAMDIKDTQVMDTTDTQGSWTSKQI